MNTNSQPVVLLTGHEGYVGSHLNRYLQDHGCFVKVLEGDLNEISPISMTEAIGHFDVIIHLAAFAGVRDSIEKPDLYLNNNVYAAREMFMLAEYCGAPILYASSSNAHEWSINPYATTKRINELDAEHYHTPSIGMRFHTIYPGRTDMLYSRMLNHDPSISFINANHHRDYIHVDDVCTAIDTLMEYVLAHSSDPISRVVDVGTGNLTNVGMLADHFNVKAQRIELPTPHERECTKADITFLRSLGWKPKHTSPLTE